MCGNGLLCISMENEPKNKNNSIVALLSSLWEILAAFWSSHMSGYFIRSIRDNKDYTGGTLKRAISRQEGYIIKQLKNLKLKKLKGHKNLDPFSLIWALGRFSI